MKIDIKDLIDSFTEDEFGAAGAIVNVLNESVDSAELYKTLDEIGDAIHERAEEDLNGKTAKIRS